MAPKIINFTENYAINDLNEMVPNCDLSELDLIDLFTTSDLLTFCKNDESTENNSFQTIKSNDNSSNAYDIIDLDKDLENILLDEPCFQLQPNDCAIKNLPEKTPLCDESCNNFLQESAQQLGSYTINMKVLGVDLNFSNVTDFSNSTSCHSDSLNSRKRKESSVTRNAKRGRKSTNNFQTKSTLKINQNKKEEDFKTNLNTIITTSNFQEIDFENVIYNGENISQNIDGFLQDQVKCSQDVTELAQNTTGFDLKFLKEIDKLLNENNPIENYEMYINSQEPDPVEQGYEYYESYEISSQDCNGNYIYENLNETVVNVMNNTQFQFSDHYYHNNSLVNESANYDESRNDNFDEMQHLKKYERRRYLLHDKNDNRNKAPIKPKPTFTATSKVLTDAHYDKSLQTYTCPYENCHKLYSKASHLKSHLRRHSGERPFVCTWHGCHWRFSRSDELSRHRRSHSGIKPYKCDLCDKCFARSDHLAKHKKVHKRRMQTAELMRLNQGELIKKRRVYKTKELRAVEVF